MSLDGDLQEFHGLRSKLDRGLASGDLRAVEEYALRFLELAANYGDDWNHGNAVHFANIALGRLAMLRGDIDSAVTYLLRSANTEGSPQLSSFGPNTSLALELLLAGRLEDVLGFLVRCSQFWEGGEATLDAWIDQIRRGEVPDFGPHLEY